MATGSPFTFKKVGEHTDLLLVSQVFKIAIFNADKGLSTVI